MPKNMERDNPNAEPRRCVTCDQLVTSRDGSRCPECVTRMTAAPKTCEQKLRKLITEALAYQAREFREDAPISGTDLLEWFSDWRKRARSILRECRP